MAKLYFIYGAMNCGKSTSLLQVAHNYEERGMHVTITKLVTDTRGSTNVVSAWASCARRTCSWGRRTTRMG